MDPDTEIELPDESATLKLGAALSRFTGLVFLHGELGAGKTTLVRGYLQALGHEGPVKSPTYTLIEPYEIAGRRVLHLDIYRLGDPAELEYMGIRDDLGEENTLLVEWPERASGFLGQPDIEIDLDYAESGRKAHISSSKPDTAREIGKVMDSLPVLRQ
jgi:tRNA threonylcarbamoyladenosine biosynthesis protein TsaE